MIGTLIRNFDIVKKSFVDAFNSDGTNTPINDYYYEKGNRGLKLFVPKSDYFEMKCFEDLLKVYGCGLKKLLTDLMIPNAVDETTQLDIVFINRSGIYVVEAKNYNCIVEYHDDKTWLRREFNGIVSKFQSPIEQNENHINNLRKILSECDESYFNSIITFADKCVIRYDAQYEKYNAKVLNLKDLKNTVKDMTKAKEIVFSDDEIYDIYHRLSEYTKVGALAKNKHIDYVNRIKRKKERK